MDAFTIMFQAFQEVVSAWPVPDDQLTDDERASRDAAILESLVPLIAEEIRDGNIDRTPFERLANPHRAVEDVQAALSERGEIERTETGWQLPGGGDATGLVARELSRYLFGNRPNIDPKDGV
jgi:hypothetical protein